MTQAWPSPPAGGAVASAIVQVGLRAKHSGGTGTGSVVLGPRFLAPENGFDDKFGEVSVEPG